MGKESANVSHPLEPEKTLNTKARSRNTADTTTACVPKNQSEDGGAALHKVELLDHSSREAVIGNNQLSQCPSQALSSLAASRVR
jgi:hypothetical protein